MHVLVRAAFGGGGRRSRISSLHTGPASDDDGRSENGVGPRGGDRHDPLRSVNDCNANGVALQAQEFFDFARPRAMLRLGGPGESESLPAIVESQTSRAAARSARRSAASIRVRMLEAFRGRGSWGFTDAEMSATICVPENSIRPRRIQLARSELIVKTNRRRATQSGNLAVVWIGRDFA